MDAHVLLFPILKVRKIKAEKNRQSPVLEYDTFWVLKQKDYHYY